MRRLATLLILVAALPALSHATSLATLLGQGGKRQFFPGASQPAGSPNVSCATYYSEAIVTTDTSIGFYRKSDGALISSTTPAAFFAGQIQGQVQRNAVAVFDRQAKRWLIAAVDINSTGQMGAILFAISDDSTLAGTWYRHRITAFINLPSGPFYMVQPSIGLCSNGYAISALGIDFATELPVIRLAFAFPKAGVLVGGNPNAFENGDTSNPTPMPLTQDFLAPSIWGVQTMGVGTSQTRVTQITQFSVTPIFIPTTVTHSQTWIKPSRNARSTNGGGLMVPSDWITSVGSYDEKRLTAAHTVELPTGQFGVLLISFTLVEGNPEERQLTTIAGASEIDCYTPSIQFNQRGDVGVGYNRSSATSAPTFEGEVRAYETTSASIVGATTLAPSLGTTFGASDWSALASSSVDTDSLSFWLGGAVFNAGGGFQARWDKLAPVYPTITNFTVAPSGVVTGNSATATVTISTPAPTQGFSLELSDDSAAVSTPDRINVPAGQTVGTATIGTLPSSVPITRHVILQLGNIKMTRNLNLVLPDITRVTANQASVQGGTNASFTVFANGLVGNSFVVVVTSSGPELAPPSSVTFNYGTSSKVFSAATSAVAASLSRFVTCTRNGRSRTATVLITP